MRKICKECFEFFREKDLKHYSKIVNQYFKRSSRFVFVLFLTSCSVQNLINKEEFKKIPKTAQFQFYDKLDTLETPCNDNVYTRSFMKTLSNNTTINYSKPIEAHIVENQLYIKFYDNQNKFHVLNFFGKRQGKRFIFYINYETISFPFLFISKEMTKFTIQIPNNSSILFQMNSTNEGAVLLFGAGNSYSEEYIFKTINHD